MDYLFSPGSARHDPQRFMGKTVYVPHFNRDAVEFASRDRDESNPGIKTLFPFLKMGVTQLGGMGAGLAVAALSHEKNLNSLST